jgi:tripartite-type tricarboxylate transporter receptor subunit TctC
MKKLLLSIFLALFMTASYAWEPKKEITIVVGFPAGGTVDNIARTMAESFTVQGYSTIVVNQPGAVGAIAANRVAAARPDGYTLMLTATAHLYSKLLKQPGATYDILEDFSHLRAIGTVENRIYANPTKVPGDMEQVVNDIRSGRKDYTWGSPFAGSEFVIRLIEDQVKQPITSVSYNGVAPLTPDLIEGRIDLAVDSGSSPLNRFVESGRLKVLATTNTKNANQITVDQYLPGIVTHSWYGFSLPANAPDDIIKFYNDIIVKSINRPITKEKLLNLGLQLPDQNSTLLVSLIKRDLIRFQPLANRIGNK